MTEAASNSDRTSGEQWLRGTSTALTRTRQGFTLFLYGSILVCLAALGVLYFEFSTELMSVVMNVLPVTALMGNLIIFAGALLLFSVPTEVNSRGLLIGAAVGFFAKVIFAGTVFWGPGFLGLPLALCLKMAAYIGLILFALIPEKSAVVSQSSRSAAESLRLDGYDGAVSPGILVHGTGDGSRIDQNHVDPHLLRDAGGIISVSLSVLSNQKKRCSREWKRNALSTTVQPLC